ncbi:hypothetical protein PV733_35580 [Streptomyces europaeiscabiei]|uniref:hypothetical protein n=1 Tax=Streptomyces europaeiscabiei TaxID=146819 RepID=UPI0029BA9C2B|nr:hypothetical protein [Streptomyces europaeiscabiei]MDX2762886.1 hypothetical protein [Streptomyces europaeiscabiei]MDX3714164.1 hypothetical protein [Streptomyces europaeiscabiei]MDX3836000.1 hypothetical protein [Streptomyces europaeiscabiei]
MLSLAFRDDHAVVHLLSDTERMSLLVGDGTVPSGAEVEVPIMDDLAAFTGGFVVDIDRAWDLVHDFTQSRAAGPLVSRFRDCGCPMLDQISEEHIRPGTMGLV